MKELYGITEEDIEETRSWEEARVTIDIETKTFNFDVKHEYSLEELLEDYEIPKEEIKDTSIKLTNIPFVEIFNLKAFIDKANYYKNYYFHNTCDDTYFGLIQ